MSRANITNPVSQAQAFFSNVFGQRTSDNEAPASVLAEWNKYSSASSDPSQADRLLSQVEEGAGNVGTFLSQQFSKAVSGVQTGVSTVSSGVASVGSSVQNHVPSSTSLTYFFAFLGTGLLFEILAFSIFLPVIVLAPAKFALCFTIGSALMMASFISLKGWQQQLSHMMSPERLPFSLGYVGSMGATLYAALGMHSYIFSLVCCAAQVVALLYYLLSYFPGGADSVRFFLRLFYSAFVQCLGIVQRSVLR